MKYKLSTIETPKGKFILVGSSIPVILDKFYQSKAEAETAIKTFEQAHGLFAEQESKI